MVLKFGKHRIYSGHTFRSPCWNLYLREYRKLAYIIRGDKNANGEAIVSGKLGVDDIQASNIQYSLNKRKRWLLPTQLINAIKSGQFEAEEYCVQLFEKHNRKSANCKSAHFSKGKLRAFSVYTKTCRRKRKRSGYMCTQSVKNRNDGCPKTKYKKLVRKKLVSFPEMDYVNQTLVKSEITFDVVHPAPLHSLFTQSYGNKVNILERSKYEKIRRHNREIIMSDVYIFRDDANNVTDDLDNLDVVLHESIADRTMVELGDFVQHAINQSSHKTINNDNAFNDFVFISGCEEWLSYNDVGGDNPVRVILDHQDTYSGRLTEVYGDKYMECGCFPRKFIVEISDDVMALDVFSQPWNQKVKPVHVCVAFVHDIENEINTTKDGVYKVYLNNSFSEDATTLRIQTLFDYSETNVDECLKSALFFIESLPGLVQIDQVLPWDRTTSQPRVEHLYGWNSYNYVPVDEFHYRSFMASNQTDTIDGAARESCTVEGRVSMSFGQLCGICYDDIGSECSGTALKQCGHWFCDGCWKEHLVLNVNSGSRSIECPEYRCKVNVDHGTMLSLLSIQDVIKYTRLRHDENVDRSEETKWCPNVRCGRVLVRTDPKVATVYCDCGHKLCFDCLGAAHWPAPCGSVERYQSVLREIGLGDNEPDYTSVVAVHGMHCPNCKQFFEKIDGCPRMHCLCRKSFCWGCGKDWFTNVHGKRCETLGKQTVHINLARRYIYSASLQNEWIDAALEHRLYRQPEKIRLLRANTSRIAKELTKFMNKCHCSLSLDFSGSKRVYTKESEKIPEFLQNLFTINSELHFIAENMAFSLGSELYSPHSDYFKIQLKKLTFLCRNIEYCFSEWIDKESALSRLRRMKEMRSTSLQLMKSIVTHTQKQKHNICSGDVIKEYSTIHVRQEYKYNEEGVDCRTSASRIRSRARAKIGKTKWSYKSSWVTGRNTNKCNIFVADVLKEAKAKAPERWPARLVKYAPIGAEEWANKRSSYLKKDKCWDLCRNPQSGDVIAKGGHVGIVTGNRKTTSATYDSVVENDWGFRSSPKPTCWRYQYNKSGC